MQKHHKNIIKVDHMTVHIRNFQKSYLAENNYIHLLIQINRFIKNIWFKRMIHSYSQVWNTFSVDNSLNFVWFLIQTYDFL